MNDLGWAIVVLIVLGLLTFLAKWLIADISAKWSRNLIHVGMGCVSLGFPFMSLDRLTVLYLGLLIMTALLMLRFTKLRKIFGSILLGTSRKSFGEFYFVIAVVIVYLVYNEVYEYLISIAVLTFAQCSTSLIRLSDRRFSIPPTKEEEKSNEGSFMFFIVAYFCTLIPLQLMSEIGRAEVLVVSFLIGVLAALIKMVSVNGNDNFLLAILTFAFLRHNIYQSLTDIFIGLGMMLLLIISFMLIYKLTSITKLSVVYSLFAAYIILIQGGYTWLIPAGLLFIMFGILPFISKEERQLMHNYRVVECNAIVGISCLVISIFVPEYEEVLYLAFSLAFGCHLTINTYSRLVNYKQRTVTFASIYSILKTIIFISIPTFIFSELGSLEIIIYLLFLLSSIHFAIYLTRKFNYRHITNEKLMGYKLSVGAVVMLFVIVLVQFIL